MRKFIVIAALLLPLPGTTQTTGAAHAQNLRQPHSLAPCCSVVDVQPEPATPCCAIATARNIRTGETFRFRVDGALKTSLRAGQPVALDSSGQWASVGGERLRVFGPPVMGATGAAATAGESPADVRVRELEARLAEAESRASAAASTPPRAATPSAGVPCRSLSVLGVWATPASPLTVTVNGAPVGVYDGSISVTLDGFLRSGANVVGFSYPAAARPSTEAALKCQPPGGGSKTTILSFKPSSERLQAEAQVTFTAR